jgi:predicted DNA repair protein MutK
VAGTSLLALIDDIAAILDDVSIMTKVATKKTAGVLGDDLALNAQQVAGVAAERELPVVWAVAKGSMRNKLILVPAALAISTFAPWAVTPLLMVGGAFLCYEGAEKLAHRLLHSKAEDDAERAARIRALASAEVDPVDLEKDKIKGAVRTDFILSAEIIAITLGTVAGAGFMTQLSVLTTIAILMTVGVYGFVAGVVKLDDAGLYLARPTSSGDARSIRQSLGRAIIFVAPWLMKTLSVLGTAAMFLVGGGILAHGIPGAETLIQRLSDPLGSLAGVGALLTAIGPSLLQGVLGVLAGVLVLAVVAIGKRIAGK